jgi:hypothetical protein
MIHGKAVPVFISSKQREFIAERESILKKVEDMPVLVPEMMERWRPSRIDPRSNYLEMVRSSFLYVGLFGCSYSQATVDEYRAALENDFREILIYVRRCECREAELQKLIEEFDGRHMYTVFSNWELEVAPIFERHLWEAVVSMLACYKRLGDTLRADDRDPVGQEILKERAEIEPILPILPNSDEELRVIVRKIQDGIPKAFRAEGTPRAQT